MSRGHALGLASIVLLGLLLRGALIVWRSDELTQDRDAYLGIAAGVAEGRGYSSPGSTTPTAFRPPLYPLLLAAAPQSHTGVWVAVINLVAGGATIGLTWLLASRFALGDGAASLAALLVAVDPLLIRYSSQPMTESVCTLLVTAWLWQLLRLRGRPSVASGLATGLLFGLAALCRPTVWAAGGLVAVWGWWSWRRERRWSDPVDCPDAPGVQPRSRRVVSVVAAAAGCVAIALPWVVRNWVVMGRPILTTTHGGYTLALGNNDVFYASVVRQPWGTEWDGSRGPDQHRWIASAQVAMERDGVEGELAADAWMRSQAWSSIRRAPTDFVRASLLRQAWFWNVVPSGEARAGWPAAITWAVGGGYALWWTASAIGLASLVTARRTDWIPALLIIAAFAGTHLLYWSNVRMRAPLVPILAVLAVQGVVAVAQSLRSRPA